MDELIKACENGDLETVKYLVENGANIHVCDDAPLQDAALKGHLEIIIYLREIVGDKWKCHDCLVKVTCMDLCKERRK